MKTCIHTRCIGRAKPTLPAAIVILLILTAVQLGANPTFLLEAESPYILNNLQLEGNLVAGYETGAIPTAIFIPNVSAGFFDWLQVRLDGIMALFVNGPDFRFAELEASAKAAVPWINSERFSLFPYLTVHWTIGPPYTQTYTGNLTDVHTVISQHGDSGLDFIGGFVGTMNLTGISSALDLLFSFDYTRSELRTYNLALLQESTKNRLRLFLTPSVRIGEAYDRSIAISCALQNRIVYWFSRGFMYDLLPQATIGFTPSFSITVGVDVPIVGGHVYKILLAGQYRYQIRSRRIIRIRVDGLHFPPDSAVLYGPENEKSDENRKIIETLYRKLEKYPDYNIIVEGHTSLVHWDDSAKGAVEQRDECIPLSNARAGVVREALIALGLPASRLSSIGKGASEPVVGFSNPDIQWKNRRVEIRLERIE